jgi:hypothetical protein
MFKRVLMLAAAVSLGACNSGPSQTSGNTVGGANIVSATKVELAKAAPSLSLDWGKKAQGGQLAIADVVTYGGPKVTITAPTGWQLIRDDSTATTRQSIYWHAVGANEPSASSWTFGTPVDVQGAIVLLDNAATSSPVDMSAGSTGTGGTLTARSIATTADADLILSFFATDFSHPGLLGPPQAMPDDTETLINQEAAINEFWILASYQTENGATADQVVNVPQLFNWTAAQVAIRRANSPATPQ